MSVLMSVWNPDAEPWEALREAQRSGAAPVHMAKALSEMGWTLAPGGSDGWRDGYNKGYEHGWEQCAAAVHEYRGQVRDLEAENKRLKDGLETVCEVGDRAAVVAAREALAGSPGGDEQPSQREYVEAFDRARRRVESASVSVPEEPEGEGVAELVARELGEATVKFAPMTGPHEGWAVIREEVDELWDEVKGDQDRDRMREEAVQVAAMAMRFVTDVCGVSAPMPVEEPDLIHGNVGQSSGANVALAAAPEMKEPEPGKPVECDKCGSVTFATAEEVVEWLREPSLDLEGLARLDAEIGQIEANKRMDPDVKLSVRERVRLFGLQQAREWLVREAE